MILTDYKNVIQTGSSGDVIVGHFAINYHNEAPQLGVDLEELYAAQIADGDLNPPEWNIQGRQVNVYKYVFQAYVFALTNSAIQDSMGMYHSLSWIRLVQVAKREKGVGHSR